jgi:hypothetical protein
MDCGGPVVCVLNSNKAKRKPFHLEIKSCGHEEPEALSESNANLRTPKRKLRVEDVKKNKVGNVRLQIQRK